MRKLAIIFATLVLTNCATDNGHFGDIGRFQISGFEWETGYGHSWSDGYNSNLSGVLAPEHGNFGPSTFNANRSFDMDEDRVDTSFKFIWSLK
jgi:hypothetical protein